MTTLFATPKTLLGLVLGERLAPELERTFTRNGPNQLDGSLVLDGHSVSVAISVAGTRVRGVHLTYQPPFSVDEGDEARCAQVVADWATKLEPHFGMKATKTKRGFALTIKKPVLAHVALHHRVVRGQGGEDPSHSVSLSHELDPSVVLGADASELWFDLSAVAALLVSKKYPLAKVTEIATKHFSGTVHSASADWQRVVFHARPAKVDRACETLQTLMLRIPWDDLERVGWLLAEFCSLGVHEAAVAKKRWVQLPVAVLRFVLEQVAPPVKERADVAVMILGALTRGDAEATRGVAARLGPGEQAPFFGIDEEVGDRLFALLTSHDDELGKLRFALRDHSGAAAAACTRVLAGSAAELPTLPSVEDPWARRRAECWARYFHMLRHRFPAHFEVVVGAFARRSQLFDKDTIPSIAAVAGEQVSKTVWRIGRAKFTARGNQVSAAVEPDPT